VFGKNGGKTTSPGRGGSGNVQNRSQSSNDTLAGNKYNVGRYGKGGREAILAALCRASYIRLTIYTRSAHCKNQLVTTRGG